MPIKYEQSETYVPSWSAYVAMLDRWAAATRSEPERSWDGAGKYRYGGYDSDEGRPVATLEKIP